MSRPSERHTRQGQPRQAVAEVRGPDEYDTPDWPMWKSGRGGSKQNLTVLALPGCWCGGRFGHDWPGKAEGAPHPRDMS